MDLRALLTSLLPNIFQGKPEDGPRAIPGELAFSDPLRLFSTRGLAQFNPSVLVTRKGLQIFDEIRRDDQVKAALSFKKHAVMAAGWQVVSPEGQPDDWEVTRFVEEQFLTMQGTLEESLLRIMTALDYGYSISELVYETIEEGEFAGHIGLKSLKDRRPHCFRFDVDVHGNLFEDGLIQEGTSMAAQLRLPVEKFVIYVYQFEFGNWFGNSDLEAAYRSWWVKNNTYKWLGMMLERYGIPPIFMLYNPDNFNPAQIDQLKIILNRLQAATSGMIPRTDEKSLELWTPELAGQVADVFIPAMDMFNRDIARALLMPGMLGVTPDGGGSFARAKKIFDVFLFHVDFLQQQIAEVVVNEQIIRPLVNLNFPVDEMPHFEFLPVTDESRNDLLKTWAQLVKIKVVQSGEKDEAHIRNLLEFPEPEERPEGDDDDGSDDDSLGDLDNLFPDIDPGGPERFKQQRYVEPVSRSMTEAEKAVDFPAMEKRFKKLETKYLQAMTAETLKFRKTTVDKLRAAPEATVDAIPETELFQFRTDVHLLTQEFLFEGFNAGRQTVRREVKSAGRGKRRSVNLQDASFIPEAALAFLETRASFISDTLSDDMRKVVLAAIIQGLKQGLPVNEIIENILEAMAPFAGDPSSVPDPKVVTPARLATIARTELTESFNQGRLVEMRDPEVQDFVAGVQYSAIIDQVTTEVCRHLDERIFRLDDPDLSRLTPPRHFNCRSILVPVTIDIAPEPSEFITDTQKGKGFELSSPGF